MIIMPWPFRPSCRAILKVDSSGDDIDCVVCEYSNNLANLKELPSTTTYSSDRPVPLWAKSDEEQKALQRSSEPTRATVEEPCVKCGHGIVGFYTVQMRSVDEGQTVFYECPACKHTWSINNWRVCVFLLSSVSFTNLVEANITRRPECECEMCHHDKCQNVGRPEWKRALLSTCHFSKFHGKVGGELSGQGRGLASSAAIIAFDTKWVMILL
jgi:DNA-directed RNA polymerase I subunit RPA12